MEATLQTLKTLNGPTGLELFRWGRRIRKDPLRTYRDLHQTFGDLVYCPWPNRKILFAYHPDYIEYVLKDRHQNFDKGAQYDELKPLLGQGLLTSEGDLWRQQRRLMAKQFHSSTIDLNIDQLHDVITAAFERSGPGFLDADEFFSRVTLDIAGKLFFGADVDNFSRTISEGLSHEMEKVNRRMRSPFPIPLGVPTPENLARKRHIRNMNSVVEKIMAEDQAGKSWNVLSNLMAGDHTQSTQIRDEVMTLLLAGHETTSNMLTWTTWFLSRHPKWQERLSLALMATGKKARELTRADAHSLKEFRCVLFESLRLMPPIPAIARMTKEADEIGGFHVPAGITVVAQPWVTHVDPRFWDKPHDFKPERFLHRPERKDDYTFFPFARGPRSCIGEEFAMVEATLILAGFIERFSWEVETGFVPEPVHNLTLRSRNGMKFQLRNR